MPIKRIDVHAKESDAEFAKHEGKFFDASQSKIGSAETRKHKERRNKTEKIRIPPTD